MSKHRHHVGDNEEPLSRSERLEKAAEHKAKALWHMNEANRMARECERRLGKKIPLPFPDLAESDSNA